MSDTLSLANALARMSRDDLTAVVGARRPHSPAAVTDPIGLAVELLRSDSIAHAVSMLHRDVLRALANGEVRASDVATLSQLGLLGQGPAASEHTVPSAVVEVVRHRLETVANRGELAVHDHAYDVDRSINPTAWTVPALTAVTLGAEVIRALIVRPGRANRTGTISVSTLRTLAESLQATQADLDSNIRALRTAGLLVVLDRELVCTQAGLDWLELGHVDRWQALAFATMRRFPVPLWRTMRELSSEQHELPAELAQRHLSSQASSFPLLSDAELERVSRFLSLATYLGLVHAGFLTAPAAMILSQQSGERGTPDVGASDEPRASTTDITNHVVVAMPDTVETFYVQPDLSVVVTGPLDPNTEATLAACSDPEQLGVAMTRRISERSLRRAVLQGLDIEELRAFLTQRSITGLPQPLEYVIADVGRARIRPEASLQSPTAVRAPEPPPAAAAGQTLPTELSDLVDRVHEAAIAEPAQSGVARRLELAIREQEEVRVTAAARGQTVSFTVKPLSLSSGRLRASDAQADVVRTLPIATIVEVDAAGSDAVAVVGAVDSTAPEARTSPRRPVRAAS